MSYINDPRENIINRENGFMLEDDNRKENMYKWSGKVLDLCDLPVEEYMKPMTVITIGGGTSPETGETLYLLTFMNGENIISSAMTKPGSIIVYPKMQNYTDSGTGVEYVFMWDNESYNGQLMPSHDLIIKGSYQAVAPIYYGSYVVPVSAYSEENISKYYNEKDLTTKYYQLVSVESCDGKDFPTNIFMPAYLPLKDFTGKKANDEAKKYYQLPAFIMPLYVVENYLISVNNSVTEEWDNFITDEQVINIKGTDYYFYSRKANDTLIASKEDNSDMAIKIRLTKK